MAATKEDSIQVLYAEENIWAKQLMIATLFDTSKSNISMHFKTIFQDGEVDEKATVKEFLTVQNKMP